MKFSDLSKTLLRKVNKNDALTSSDYPSDVYFETEISKKIVEINEYTNKDSFENGRSEGAIGWEYAFSILFFVDNVYISKVLKGNYESVSINHSYSFNPIYLNQNKNVQFEIKLDDKKYKTKSFETEKIRDNLLYGITATFHTHPKFIHSPGVSQYTFFSSKDIGSLIYGRTPILGLVMGRDLWLACKTKDSQMIDPGLLREASGIELNEGIDKLPSFVKKEMKDFGIEFYYGKVGGSLKRL